MTLTLPSVRYGKVCGSSNSVRVIARAGCTSSPGNHSYTQAIRNFMYQYFYSAVRVINPLYHLVSRNNTMSLFSPKSLLARLHTCDIIPL
jgi:hypothetical protein